MNIAYVTAGAAGMYCGSCLHDNALASALIREGNEVSLIPTYTPIRTDEQDVSIDQVFYGAINVYLEQKSSIFRYTPRFLDRWLRHPKLLNWISGRQSSVDAKQLGELTLSVLQGEEGNQVKELDRLVDWLGNDLKPDIVNLTNTMFLGMARRIRERLDIPVVCTVQGEDIFYDDLVEPYKGRILETLRERVRDVDGLLSTSDYYVEPMAQLLHVDRGEIDVVPLGIKMDEFQSAQPRAVDQPFTLGYLARICPEKGLHLLIEAFRRWTERVGNDVPLRLRIAGYQGERDRAYADGLQAQIAEMGLGDRIDWVGEVDRDQKLDFLSSLHLFCVPTVYREPKGLSIIEAVAHAVPVVQPAHGAFPEMLNEFGGGVLVEPNQIDALVDQFEALRNDDAARLQLAREGSEKVRQLRNDRTMAQRTIQFYDRVIQGYRDA